MARRSGPADTRMMNVIHNALRRDLVRLHAILTISPSPSATQRRALGEHAVWLMDFLHAHHGAEDERLWPLVRQRNPASHGLLDSLEADHRRVDPAAREVAAAGCRYAHCDDDSARRELAAAVDTLSVVLFPHLDREVDVAMPVVSGSVTAGEWKAMEDALNKDKSMSQLAKEGHWLLEDLDPEGHQVVAQVVPPIPRFILLHLYGRSYRREARERWQPQVAHGPGRP